MHFKLNLKRRAALLLLAMLCSFTGAWADNELTVYDGTATTRLVPAYIYYFDDYCRSQFVIPATDLTAMNGGDICSIKFYTTNDNVPYTTASTVDVYLKEVDYTTMTGLEAKSSATIVYQGTLSIVGEGSGGSLTITLSTPYTYNGGNLLIGIENTTDPEYKSIYFYGQEVTGASWAGYNSSSLANVTGAQQNFIPKTTFTYKLIKRPTSLATSTITYNSATLTWTENGTATAWVVAYKAEGDADFTEVDATTNPFTTLTGLTPETDYTAKVRAKEGSDVSVWSNAVAFTTPAQFPAPTALAANNITVNSADISWTGSADSYNLRYRVDRGFHYNFETAEAFAVDEFSPCSTYDGDGLSTYGISDYSMPNANYTGSVIAFSDNDYWAAHSGNTMGAFMDAIPDTNGGPTANDDYFILPAITIESGSKFSFWARSVTAKYGLERMKVGVYDGNGTFSSYLEGSATTYVEVPVDWTEYSYDLSAYAGQTIQLAINCVSSDAFALLIDDINVSLPSEWSTSIAVSTPYQIENLTTETNYIVQVQAVYTTPESGTSAWTETSFTTLSFNPIATNVVVTPTHTSATISWTASSDSYEVKYRTAAYSEKIFFEDFENGIGDWTTSNLEDGGGVLNGAGIGDGFGFAFIYTSNPPQYLISPELNGIVAGNKLSFSYCNYDSNYRESFKVGYSTTGNDVENDFTWSDETTVGADTNWHLYELTLPAGVKYIAIQCTSDDRWYLFIDNIGIYGADVPAGAWTTVPTTETSVELTGLEMDTKYEYQIIGIKDSTPNEGTAIASFTTYSENDKMFLADGNWNVASNWTPAGVPSTTNNAYICAAVTIPSGVVATAKHIKIDGGSITLKDGAELKTNNPVDVTMEKNIVGYGDGDGKFNLVASSAKSGSTSTEIDGLMEGDYDYFLFARSENLEWRSYALTSFNMKTGNGYLYANKENKTLKFIGETWASIGNRLSMSVTYNDSYPMNMILAGNTFTCTGTIYFEGSSNTTGTIYKLNAAGDGFEAYEGYASVAPGEAVLVEYSEDGTIYYESEDYGNGTSLGAAEILLPQHGSTANADAGPVVELVDNADNSSLITSFNGKYATVKLSGRTLKKNGTWHTLCLPFDLTIAGSALADGTAKVLDNANTSFASNKLTIKFDAAPATISAGTPFIVKWANSGDVITNPVFTNVAINSASTTTVGFTGGSFKGNFSPVALPSGPENLYFGSDNNLYWPSAGVTVKSNRAYFNLPGATEAPNITLDYEDDVITGIAGIENVSSRDNENIYDLQGRKVEQPTQKGVYIMNGRKVVIK